MANIPIIKTIEAAKTDSLNINTVYDFVAKLQFQGKYVNFIENATFLPLL